MSNREIKFRAMSVVNCKHQGIKVGDWIYGSYIESGCDAPCIIFGDGEQCEIDRKTLGQYTGLKDRNGVEVFEGDLAMVRECRVCEVIFHQEAGCWDLKLVNVVSSLPVGAVSPASWKYHALVIGNIHENPELLEDM